MKTKFETKSMINNSIVRFSNRLSFCNWKIHFWSSKTKTKNSVKTNDTHNGKIKFLYYRHTGSNTKKHNMITKREKKWFHSPLPQSRLWRVIHKFLIVGFVCIHNCAHNPITNRCLSSDRSFYFCWNWIDIEKKRGKNTTMKFKLREK